MPKLTTQYSESMNPGAVRFRVLATGEEGTGVSSNNGSRNIGHYVTIGSENNIWAIEICMDETGEIRTYLKDRVEELPDDEG